MNVKELYDQVAKLGFVDSLDDDDAFYYAANRALLQVGAIRPAIRTCIINHRPLENLLDVTGEVEVREDTVFQTLGARALYFEVCGAGSAKLELYDPTTSLWDKYVPITWNDSGSTYIPVKKFIRDENGNFFTGAVRIKFVAGDYIYSVKNVAFYSATYSAVEDDIPVYEEYSRYDIAAMCSDFWTLCSPPIKDTSEFERLGAGYDIADGRILLLPRNAKGIYRVQYNHKPEAITFEALPQQNEKNIDLAEDLCALMPLLIASYVWLDEEPEKAQYYFNLYRENAANIERKTRCTAPISIHTNGWA